MALTTGQRLDIWEDLERRGPWRGGREGDWRRPVWTLTADELLEYYAAIKDSACPLWQVLGCPHGSHDKVNRANTLLKQAGLIQFERGRWTAL